MSKLVGPGSKYTDADRRRAALEYSIYGVASKVSQRTGIPETTLCGWRKTEWWHQLIEEVRSEKEEQIRAGDERIITLAQREIEDRLENGDVQLVRTSEGVKEHRVPVKARDAAVIKGISDDKRRLSLSQPTSIRADSANIKELAEAFAKLSQDHRRIQNSVISVQDETE